MRMTDDRLGDVYYDASRSDETVSLKGLRAVADAAERRVLDRLETFLVDECDQLSPVWMDVHHEIRAMREELDRGDANG